MILITPFCHLLATENNLSKTINLVAQIVNHPDELSEKFQSAFTYSASGTVLLEEFFAGKEIGLVGFVSDFKYTNLGITQIEHFDLPDMFICRQSIFPAPLRKELKQRIVDLNSRLFESLGPKFGIAFSQYKVNEESGEIRLMETAIRGPAGLNSSHLVPLVCGIDVLPLLIELVSGRRDTVKIEESKLLNRAAGVVFFYLPAGVICQINGMEKVRSLADVHKVVLDDIVVGRKIEAMKDMTGRQGPIVFSGIDRQDCEETIRRIQETLTVEVETSEGVKGMVWS